MSAQWRAGTSQLRGNKRPDASTRISRHGRFDGGIEAVRARLETLRCRAAAAPEALESILLEAFEELQTTLEELQVADEELRRQNDELAIASHAAEAERRRYQELFDFAPYGYLVTDAVAVILEANRAAARLLAVPQPRLLGRPMTLFLAQGECQPFLTQLRQLAECGRIQEWEVNLQPHGGMPFHAALTATHVRDAGGQLVGFRWLIRDISERKAAEAKVLDAQCALQDSREQLRALTTHLQERQEEERRRIAREIHDELGQVLTVLKIDVAWFSNRLGTTDPVYQQRLGAMLGLLDSLVTAVRRISTALRPEILDDLGLSAAIEWQLQEVCQRTGMAYELALPGEDLAMEQGQATAMFRIFQEALTNVLRHAAASKVTVRMIRQPDRLVLEVIDNGRGITPRQLADRRSLGLLSMRERAHLWSGDVSIRGEPGRGTTVTLRMPYGALTASDAET